MTSRPWYPFFWSDYSGKTLHLTMAQHGAYILLLRWIYTTGTAIPHKQRFSIAQARLDSERSDVEAMLGQFFVRKKDGWHNPKADEVMQDAEIRHKKLVEAGRAGGKARSSEAISDAQARLKLPQPQPQEVSKKENFNLIGFGKSGNGHVTIKDPLDRLERFKKKLAESFPKDGWLIVAEAQNVNSVDYARCLALCKAQAKLLGKGWPHTWGT
jgi:uncharacterized protein YdaU (DUF1376 family)